MKGRIVGGRAVVPPHPLLPRFDPEFELGAYQTVFVRDRESRRPPLFVANMLAQHGYSRPNAPAIRYDALGDCLARLACEADFYGADVVMPRIGCGLAGGSWDRVEPLIVKAFEGTGVDVYVVDLPRGE